MKTHLKTSQDILSSILKKKIKEEFDELYHLYLVQVNTSLSPKYFLEKNLTRIHKQEQLLNEYNEMLNLFLQEYFVLINSHFHTREWSLISFILNEQYNYYFFKSHAEFLDNIENFHESCIETLNNNLVIFINNSNFRIKI